MDRIRTETTFDPRPAWSARRLPYTIGFVIESPSTSTHSSQPRLHSSMAIGDRNLKRPRNSTTNTGPARRRFHLRLSFQRLTLAWALDHAQRPSPPRLFVRIQLPFTMLANALRDTESLADQLHTHTHSAAGDRIPAGTRPPQLQRPAFDGIKTRPRSTIHSPTFCPTRAERPAARRPRPRTHHPSMQTTTKQTLRDSPRPPAHARVQQHQGSGGVGPRQQPERPGRSSDPRLHPETVTRAQSHHSAGVVGHRNPF